MNERSFIYIDIYCSWVDHVNNNNNNNNNNRAPLVQYHLDFQEENTRQYLDKRHGCHIVCHTNENRFDTFQLIQTTTTTTTKEDQQKYRSDH